MRAAVAAAAATTAAARRARRRRRGSTQRRRGADGRAAGAHACAAIADAATATATATATAKADAAQPRRAAARASGAATAARVRRVTRRRERVADARRAGEHGSSGTVCDGIGVNSVGEGACRGRGRPRWHGCPAAADAPHGCPAAAGGSPCCRRARTCAGSAAHGRVGGPEGGGGRGEGARGGERTRLLALPRKSVRAPFLVEPRFGCGSGHGIPRCGPAKGMNTAAAARPFTPHRHRACVASASFPAAARSEVCGRRRQRGRIDVARSTREGRPETGLGRPGTNQPSRRDGLAARRGVRDSCAKEKPSLPGGGKTRRAAAAAAAARKGMPKRRRCRSPITGMPSRTIFRPTIMRISQDLNIHISHSFPCAALIRAYMPCCGSVEHDRSGRPPSEQIRLCCLGRQAKDGQQMPGAKGKLAQKMWLASKMISPVDSVNSVYSLSPWKQGLSS
eukprot:356488-Chlamydomonas_euryale.AAC.8